MLNRNFLITTLHQYHHIRELLAGRLPIYSWSERRWVVLNKCTSDTIEWSWYDWNNRGVIVYESRWRASFRALERHLYHTVIHPLIEIRLSLWRIIHSSSYWSNILGSVLLDLNLTAQEFRSGLMLAVCHPWRWCLFNLLLNWRATSLPAHQLFALLKYPRYHLLHQLLLFLEASSVYFLPRSELLLLTTSSFVHTRDSLCIHTSYFNSYLWSIILKAISDY